MADLDDHTLTELRREGSSLLFTDVVTLVERHHPHDQPGVPEETLLAYADALARDADYAFDAAAFREELDDRLADAETWAGENRVYRLGDDRVSRYPESWHERLGGTADVREFVAFLQEEVPEFKGDVGRGGAGPGIPEQALLDVVAVVGGVDRDDAKARLQELRERGELVEDADQHPDAGVVLRDRDGEDDDRPGAGLGT